MRKISILIIFFIICAFASCKKKTEVILPPPEPSTLKILDDSEAQEKLFKTFMQAYPDLISSVQFINNDWTMLVNGQRFYFACGRFLPENLRNQWEDYIPWDFYEYPWTGTEEERRVIFNNPVYSVGSSFLFDALLSSSTEDDSWDAQVKYSFLGVKVLMHRYITPKLDNIQTLIREAAKEDPSINEWIRELMTSPPNNGWNWRMILGTRRKSNHSYGTAIDLLPRDLKGRATYWKFETQKENKKQKNKEQVFYTPPEIVIEIFEQHGFIWGGKWDLIDTMHFEYRPEILLLNNHSVLY